VINAPLEPVHTTRSNTSIGWKVTGNGLLRHVELMDDEVEVHDETGVEAEQRFYRGLFAP
jgi:hypothetical protein